jgi:hypothetical protein
MTTPPGRYVTPCPRVGQPGITPLPAGTELGSCGECGATVWVSPPPGWGHGPPPGEPYPLCTPCFLVWTSEGQ